MSLQQRRLLFYSFIFLFILVSPFAILYATGRTINWQHLKIQKTASLIIKSEPANAEIFLNDKRPTLFLDRIFGKTTPPRTPAKLSNLTPDTYRLRIENPGYWPWEEKITIKSDEVLTIGPVRLFRNSTPSLAFPLSEQTKVEASPDGRTVLSLSDKELTLIQVPEQKQFKLELPIETAGNIIWSNNQDIFVINEEYVINRSSELISRLSEHITPAPTFVRLDVTNNDLIYYVQKNELHRYNLLTKTDEAIFNLSNLLVGRELFDYTVSERQIYLAFRNNNQAEVITLNSNSPDRQTIAALPAGIYHFIPENNKILLFEKNSGGLFLFEQPLPVLFAPRLTAVAKNYTVGRWQNNTITYATPFEIRNWDDNHETLISRLGEPIIGLSRLASDNQILYGTSTSLNVWSPTNALFSQSMRLVDIQNLTHLLTVADEELYFVGRFNNEFGIFHLSF